MITVHKNSDWLANVCPEYFEAIFHRPLWHHRPKAFAYNAYAIIRPWFQTAQLVSLTVYRCMITSFSTGSSTSVATFCSHCFLTIELTVMHCAIGDMTSYCTADSIHWLTLFNFMIRQLFKDCYWLWFYTCVYTVFSIFQYVRLLHYVRHLNKWICIYTVFVL